MGRLVLEIPWIQSNQLERAASGSTGETQQRICQGLESTDLQTLS